MKRINVTKAQFDAMRPELEALATDWADRECVSFDDAVRQTAVNGPGAGSIWAMPAIDSKRVVALLVELEPAIGCEIPCSVIRRGGYATRALLAVDLLARIRERCLDDPTPTVKASAVNSDADASRTIGPSTIGGLA